MNGGVCTPFFRSYVCKCTKDYIGPKCEKSKEFIIYINQRFFKTQSLNMINFLFFLFFWLYYVSRNIFINLWFECKLISSSFLFPLFYYIHQFSWVFFFTIECMYRKSGCIIKLIVQIWYIIYLMAYNFSSNMKQIFLTTHLFFSHRQKAALGL